MCHIYVILLKKGNGGRNKHPLKESSYKNKILVIFSVVDTEADYSRDNSQLQSKTYLVLNDLKMIELMYNENQKFMNFYFHPKWELVVKESRLVQGHNIKYYRKLYEDRKMEQN